MSGIEMLCFDVLGDYVDPASVAIDEDAETVEVFGLPPILRTFVREDWKSAVAGTEYARYRLIIKQGAHGAVKNPPIEAGKGN